jgi:hypothetical protein
VFLVAIISLVDSNWLETMHELKAVQLDDEDSSQYFINYLPNDSDSTESNPSNDSDHSPNEADHGTDVSTLPDCLIVTPVPQDLFTDPVLKVSNTDESCQ